MRHARLTTAAPRKCGSSASALTSAVAQSTFGSDVLGDRLAIPRIESIAGSSARTRRSAQPTFPVAPTTTTRMRTTCPPTTRRNTRRENTCKKSLAQTQTNRAGRTQPANRHRGLVLLQLDELAILSRRDRAPRVPGDLQDHDGDEQTENRNDNPTTE